MVKSPEERKGQFAAQVERTLGIIPGTKLWSPYPFSGVNLQDAPVAIDDKEFSYIENFFRLGNGYLRTAWDVGAPIYTTQNTGSILPYFFWFNIAATDYLIVFLNDGSAIQIRQSDGQQTTVAQPGTFWQLGTAQNLPVCTQWGNKYIIIANNFGENNYWIWDGTLLYTAGTAGPEVTLQSAGANYSSLPAVTPFGGAGSGVQTTVTIENGTVTSVKVTNPGHGYVIGDTVQLQFSGGGSDTGAILLANLGSGTVGSVQITNGGTGYTSAPTVTFSAPTGATAAGTAIRNNHGNGDHILMVVVTNGGFGYTSPPTVTITGGGGLGAVANAVIQNGQVVSVNVSNSGFGYTSTPTVTFSAPTGLTTATGTATISGGAVTGVTITNPGSGYTVPPVVMFSGGGGTGAAAVSFLTSNGVTNVSVVNGGTGFIYPPTLSFVGGNGTGAAAITVLSPTTVATVQVTSGGSTQGVGGYTSAPTVNFNNAGTSGSGAAGTAVIENGMVVAVNVTNPGTGYTLPPFITFSGGGLPTGAAAASAIAKLAPTSIASVIVTNPGTGYTQAPAVEVAAGSNNAAQAVLLMMPFGISGNAIETFNSRVWIAFPFQKTTIPTGGDFLVSSPGSATDFATSDGGVLFVNSDRFLKKQYTGLRQSNGYLYTFGDSSCNVISNINTTGNPATTTFSNQNVDPQVGMAWRDTAQDYGRTILFANQTGIYGLYGGAATKVSAKLDQLFVNAVFQPTAGALTPSAAVATIFNTKHYFLLFTAIDPELGTQRNIMAVWNEGEWVICSQSPALTFIGTQEVNTQLFAWGTDGTSIYPLFAKPSSTLQKRLSTKFYGSDQNALLFIKDFVGLWLQAQDLSVGAVGINLAATMLASGIAIQPTASPNFNVNSVTNAQYTPANYPGALFQQPAFASPPPFWAVYGNGTEGFSFETLAVKFTTTSPDFALANMLIGYLENTAYL